MSEDLSKAGLLELARAERARLEAALADLRPEQWTIEGACGEWSAKDI